MKFLEYLRKNEPVALKILTGAFENGRLSHGYLLVGEPGLPLKEAAYFIAQSLVCDHPSPLADETCKTCQRLRRGSFADFLFLDGSLASIKKEEIQAVLGDFSKTPIERKGKMIYVIHLVENMTQEAVNSVLKFLEEPPDSCYAILTTENIARVLPTIVSRVETIHLVKAPYEDVVAGSIALGVEPKDADLLSLFHNDPSLVKEATENEEYPAFKELMEEALGDFAREKEEGLYRFEKVVIPAFGKKEDARKLLLLLSMLFRDAALASRGLAPRLSAYATIIDAVSAARSHLELTLQASLEARSELDMNMAPALVLEHLARTAFKE